METLGQNYFYPNRLGRIIFVAAEEILGRNGINAILNQAGLSDYIDHSPPHNQTLAIPFAHISRFQSALEEFYGPHGGRGVALRIGRASFQHILREFGPPPGLTDLAFRLLPLRNRLKLGSAAFADLFNKYTDQRVQLEDTGTVLLWHIDRCPLCWQRHTDSAACQMIVGLLQEALFWISAGKTFNVEESSCMARGDLTCTIMIEKTPMS